MALAAAAGMATPGFESYFGPDDANIGPRHWAEYPPFPPEDSKGSDDHHHHGN